MEESLLDRLIPKPVVEEEKVVVQTESPKPPTEKEAYAILGITDPAEFKAHTEFGLGIYKSERARVEKLILDNTDEGVWTPEALKDMKIETLQNLAKSIAPKDASLKIDYSIMSETKVPTLTDQEEVPPMLPSEAIVVNKKEEKEDK